MLPPFALVRLDSTIVIHRMRYTLLAQSCLTNGYSTLVSLSSSLFALN
jgi:hypothetical protein